MRPSLSVDYLQPACHQFLAFSIGQPAHARAVLFHQLHPGGFLLRFSTGWLLSFHGVNLALHASSVNHEFCYLKLGAVCRAHYSEPVKLLFIGDIVGQPGRRAVKELLPKLRQQHGVNVVVANGENAAGGSGITVKTAQEIFDSGVDIMTSGDHLWDQKEVMELLANEPRFVRPLNYPAGTPGQGSVVFEGQGLRPVAVLNLQGRTFMPPLDNPFPCARAAVERLRQQTNLIFVDFHAEATSEKVALARMLDGRVGAVIGTHTHVQTADEQIFPGGTAFLSDAGFTGPH